MRDHAVLIFSTPLDLFRYSIFILLNAGEQQQLAMGHAILSNQKLLLLDEPTEGIQPSIDDQIEDVIIGFKNSRRFAILLVGECFPCAA